jgi:epoxyqueuosine reductase
VPLKSFLSIPETLLTSLGVVDWGYTEDPLPKSYDRFNAWVGQGKHGVLSYLADHRKELRSDIRKVYPEFQSALVFLFSYAPTKKWMLENNRHEIAAYALGFEGADYHHELKRRLEIIRDRLAVKAFVSLDAQPVLERDLAYRAGLGWYAKNSMLINRKHGSYFIIGSLLLPEKLSLHLGEVDVDHCGQCVACVDACPTHAIDLESRTLIADKCISTFTIEIMKDAAAPSGFQDSRGELFGCDICQDVCPWNRKPLERTFAQFKLNERFEFLKELFFLTPKQKLIDIISSESGRSWRKRLFGTAFERPGKEGWLKNLRPSRSDS